MPLNGFNRVLLTRQKVAETWSWTCRSTFLQHQDILITNSHVKLHRLSYSLSWGHNRHTFSTLQENRFQCFFLNLHKVLFCPCFISIQLFLCWMDQNVFFIVVFFCLSPCVLEIAVYCALRATIPSSSCINKYFLLHLAQLCYYCSNSTFWFDLNKKLNLKGALWIFLVNHPITLSVKYQHTFCAS